MATKQKVGLKDVDLTTLTYDELLQKALRLQRQSQDRQMKLARATKRVAELEELVYIDALTGIPNRRAFEKAILNEVARTRRNLGTPLALCVLDIDNFKKVNDTYGHPVGDLVIKKMGAILKREARFTDFVGRMGGEEFAFILPGTDTDGARIFLERLRATIEQELVVEATKGKRTMEVRATASFGVSIWNNKEDDTAAELVERADRAVYLAKQAGRNCVEFAE